MAWTTPYGTITPPASTSWSGWMEQQTWQPAPTPTLPPPAPPPAAPTYQGAYSERRRQIAQARVTAPRGAQTSAAQQFARPSWANITTVMPGNTLWGIANRYGLTVQELMRINNLTSTLIRPGQSLYVVDPATQRPVVTDPLDPQMVPYTPPHPQAMTPEAYIQQGLNWMAQGPNYPPMGPPTPPGYVFPTTPTMPGTPGTPGTPGAPSPPGGPSPAPGPSPTPTPTPTPEPEGAAWWGQDIFGEGWVYLPTAPGEAPTQWTGEGDPVGPGWYNLRNLQFFNQLPPMWRGWLNEVMQSQQEFWTDPTMAPVQWMPSAAGQERAPLYMWEPLAGAPTPVPSQHWTQPPGAPYAPPAPPAEPLGPLAEPQPPAQGGLIADQLSSWTPPPGSPYKYFVDPGKESIPWQLPGRGIIPVPLPIAEPPGKVPMPPWREWEEEVRYPNPLPIAEPNL